MFYSVAKIEDLLEGFNEERKGFERQNVSLLARAYLLQQIEEQGLSCRSEIVKDERGKPFFKEGGLCFSLSHCRTHLAVAFDSREIGVDVQPIAKGKLELARRFFHPGEYEYLCSVDTCCQDLAFTQLWTIKEAYVKKYGTGIANNFSNVDLSPSSFKKEQLFTIGQDKILSSFLEDGDLFVSVVY